MCKSSLKSKNKTIVDDGAECFNNISFKRNTNMNLQQVLQNAILTEGCFIKIFFI